MKKNKILKAVTLILFVSLLSSCFEEDAPNQLEKYPQKVKIEFKAYSANNDSVTLLSIVYSQPNENGEDEIIDLKNVSLPFSAKYEKNILKAGEGIRFFIGSPEPGDAEITLEILVDDKIVSQKILTHHWEVESIGYQFPIYSK